MQAEDDQLEESQQVHVGRLPGPWAFLKWFERQQVDVVLCCGVNRQASATLEARGVTLIWGLTGEAEQIVADYLSGQLVAPDESPCAVQRSLGRQRRSRGRGSGPL